MSHVQDSTFQYSEMDDSKAKYLESQQDDAASTSSASVYSMSASTLFDPDSKIDLNVFPGYTAKQPVTLIMKQRGIGCVTMRHKLTVSFATPDGQPGETLFEIYEESRHQIIFRTTSGDEVMRICKTAHHFSQNHEYSGVSPSGEVKWSAHIQRKFLASTYYGFTVYPNQHTPQPLEFRDKIHGRDKGLVSGGQILATYNDRKICSIKRAKNVVKVAPGMDMLVALGMAFVRHDKLRDDANGVVAPSVVVTS